MNKKSQQSCFVVDIQNNYPPSFPLTLPDQGQLKDWACVVFDHENVQGAEVTLRLVDEGEMRQLNARYRHKDQPTNVLSFPADIPAAVVLELPFLGDIILCVPVIDQEAKVQAKPLLAHWAHMVVHGILHLLGYDHMSTQDAKIMEQKEILILKKLGFPDPYSEFVERGIDNE